jgi:hypothetical protein
MPKEEYCTWIQNEMNWGGENEICFLCDKFNVEIQVVMMNASSSTLTYGQGAARRGRIYLLYTGQVAFHLSRTNACVFLQRLNVT